MIFSYLEILPTSSAGPAANSDLVVHIRRTNICILIVFGVKGPGTVTGIVLCSDQFCAKIKA